MKLMSIQVARKIALAYWGFSKTAKSRASSGTDIDIIKGNDTPDEDPAKGFESKFASLVSGSWEDYTGHVGSYGRIPFETLLDFAINVKTKEEHVGESNMEEVRKWTTNLMNNNPNYFVARTVYKNQKMELLINTKH
jgi:hypothetical protein|tara:strand:- start:257 stop:667 length:411 start_codon:yes stop_codon:yes gene_type:complete